MLRELQALASEMGIAEGELLKIGREISHDGNLVSIRHMRKRDQEEMVKFLKSISYADKAEAFA